MKKIDGKECNTTAKGVSIATKFHKFKDVLFNEKTIRHKMKRIQSKKHKLRTLKKYKLGPYEFEKISLSYFDDKRYVLDDGIRTFAYFHKDGVTGGKEIEKDCDKKDCNKEDCDD